MTRMTAPLAFAALLALAGCGDDHTAPAPSVNAASTTATQEAVSRLGDVTIRASVVQTSTLPEQVAKQYGIARDDRTVMLLVAVRQGPEAKEVALPARITAVATDLRGRPQPIEMRELRTVGGGSDPALLDYIGTVDISLPDTLRFDLTIVREGGASSTMQFSRDFYPR